MFNYMAGIVKESGYGFLNMNDYYDEIGIVFEEDFADYGSHTNAVGAEKCTDFLESYLQAHYALPDHRGDAVYKSWDKSYELWKQGRMRLSGRSGSGLRTGITHNTKSSVKSASKDVPPLDGTPRSTKSYVGEACEKKF